MTLYKLSPSDLTFAWDGCKLCFYMKVKHNLGYSGVFPSMFGKIANMTSDFYLEKSTSEISPSLPPGKIKFREKWVKSAPISIPGMQSQCYIRGRFDAAIAFEDGSYGIIDYKTSDAKEEHAEFYSRQLSAYAYALENPAPGAMGLSPIVRLGLFVVTPERFERKPDNDIVFVNQTTWVEVPRNDAAFISLLGEVITTLEASSPPEPAGDCELCNYRKRMIDAGVA
jgi:hypothetical protein